LEYRRLGNSGLKISAIGLGGNNFGEDQRQTWGIDEPTSIAIIHHALDLGINYFDTADWYGNQGRSEEFIGKGVKDKRSQVIIATKFGFPTNGGPNDQGSSRYHIIKAVDASLRRLNTDYIDLYQVHRPDPETPIEETLRTLDALVRAGKVRYIGCSNFTAWQLCEAIWTSRVNNLNSFITVQPRYNLLDRTIEQEMVPCCEKYGIGVVPWGPLAGSFLTGKYRKGEAAPSDSRLATPPAMFKDLISDTNFDKVARLQAFAEERGHTVAELAISWLLSHPWLSSVIAGARKIEQVTANVKAAEWKLTPEEVAQVSEIS